MTKHLRRKKRHITFGHHSRRRIYRPSHLSVIAVLVLVCVGWGIAAERHDNSVVSASNLGTTTITTPASQPAPGGGAVIDEYTNLPGPVSQAVPAVVALQRITSGNGNGDYKAEVSSGVIISGTEVVTAGHSIMPAKTLQCSNTSVDAPGAQNQMSASRETVTAAAAMHGSQDLGLVTVRPSANFSQLPHLTVATNLPKTGATVYFINFQPTADGKVREPSASGNYAKPAIFSGTYLGTSSDGLVIATGNGQSYGHGIADTLIRKGASGGAIIDEKGRLVGLSVASDSLQADRSAGSVAQKYRVQLPAGRYQIAFAQAVSGQLVMDLRSQQTACATTVQR